MFHAALVGPKKEVEEASANVLGVFGSARNTISTPPQNLNTTDIYVQRESALRGSFDFTCAASAPAPRDLLNLGYSWLPSQFVLALESFLIFLAGIFGSCEEMSASVSEAFGSARRWNA